MKYSSNGGNSSSTLFCEQVSTVTSLFEKWNDCERTVVMYALLKRLRYPSLKFLLYSIENNLQQNFGSQNNITTLDINANNPHYLKNLITTYKTIPPIVDGTNNGTGTSTHHLNDNDSILYGSTDLVIQQQQQQDNDNKKFIKKEEILNDVLSMLPLLRPGNEDAKTIYLSLIPIAVEDTVRQIVNTELVQQVFSYLLIHPAISNDDRRSLSHWLRYLEEHIQSSFSSSGHQSFYVLSSPVDSGSKSTSVSSLSSASRNTTWQAIAPPSQPNHKQQQQQQQIDKINSIITSSPTNNAANEWNISLLKMPESLCTTSDLQQIQLNDVVSSQNSLGFMYDSAATNVVGGGSNNNQMNTATTNNDDHHVSFSRNGIEIYDFSANICDKCNGHIGYSSVLLGNSCEHHLNVSKWNLDNNKSSLAAVTNNNSTTNVKTRRSNSLTTAISSSSSSTSSVVTVNENCSNSSENLSQYAQKPRSYSLSIDNPRSGLTSCGSDTHLDDLKPNYLRFSTHNIGMSNIGQWLKSLRLHKYVSLFTNTAYEEMLEITEEYLQSLGVTKGASHKLALCIEKLKERYSQLCQIEKDLLLNQITIGTAIEDLTNIVLTPMKPVDSTSNNVAGKFLQVLDLVSQSVIKKDVIMSQDEDCVNALLWILERSIHSEAFVAHTNQLKEHKFKLSKLKMQFAPKNHHSKNGNNINLNKPRWNGKSRKTENSKGGSNDRISRKNSNDTPYLVGCSSLQQQQQQQKPSQYSHDIEKYHCTKMSSSQSQLQQCQQQQQQQMYGGSNGTTCPQYKSSSYPNFSNSIKITNQSQLMQQQQQQHHQQQSQQSQYRHHRHSLSNLIMMPASVTNAIQQQHQQQQHNQHSQQQVVFKMPKQIVAVGGNNMNLNQTCSNDVSINNVAAVTHSITDCSKNRRSNMTNIVTTTAVPSTSTTSITQPSLMAITGLMAGQNENGVVSDRINDISDIKLLARPRKSSTSLVSNLINSTNNNNNNSCNNSNTNKSNIIIDSNASLLSSSLSNSMIPVSNSNSNNSNSSRDKILNSIGDINSSLEFLCLQMTEQAIN